MQETYQTGVVLSEMERQIIERHVSRLGLGERGFSAALRIIVRDWAQLTGNLPQPAAQQPQTDVNQ